MAVTAGQDGARQRLVDRQVEQLVELHALVLAQVLADAVRHHHGVVDRVAEDGQQRRHDRQVELELQQREDADRQQHVVRSAPRSRRPRTAIRSGTRRRRLIASRPASTAMKPVILQLARHRRAHHLDAPLHVAVAERIDAPSSAPPAARPRRPAAARRGSARRSGAPKLWICTAPRPSLPSLSRSWPMSAGPVVDCTSTMRAALEVDAVVEAHGEEQRQRQRHGDDRSHQRQRPCSA